MVSPSSRAARMCTAPIIVLSARHDERAKVRALDAGADDYLTKPFGMGDSSPECVRAYAEQSRS